MLLRNNIIYHMAAEFISRRFNRFTDVVELTSAGSLVAVKMSGTSTKVKVPTMGKNDFFFLFVRLTQ